jgi:hypothetical protein
MSSALRIVLPSAHADNNQEWPWNRRLPRYLVWILDEELYGRHLSKCHSIMRTLGKNLSFNSALDAPVN